LSLTSEIFYNDTPGIRIFQKPYMVRYSRAKK